MTPRNILSRFCSTGNWPYNPQLFAEADFAPAFVTDHDIVQDSSSSSLSSQAFQSNLINEKTYSACLILATTTKDQLVLIS